MTRVQTGAHRESARHLIFLYSVVAALSLETAMATIAGDFLGPGELEPETVALTLAFLVTIVPFFHGALRHLDMFYVLTDNHASPAYALPVDFSMLFGEAALLFLLASFTTSTTPFLFTLWILFIVDIAWALITSHFCQHPRLAWNTIASDAYDFVRFQRKRIEHPELFWAFNNVIGCIALGAVLLAVAAGTIGSTVALVGGVGIAVARTVNDYRLSWKYYFPTPEHNAEEVTSDQAVTPS